MSDLRATVERTWIEVVPDDDPDTSYLEQAEFAERLNEYRQGDFGFVSVRACAEVRYLTEQGGWIVGPVIRSPGIWGIEDDSGEEYFRSVGEEEAGELGAMLEALGLPSLVLAPELLYR